MKITKDEFVSIHDAPNSEEAFDFLMAIQPTIIPPENNLSSLVNSSISTGVGVNLLPPVAEFLIRGDQSLRTPLVSVVKLRKIVLQLFVVQMRFFRLSSTFFRSLVAAILQ